MSNSFNIILLSITNLIAYWNDRISTDSFLIVWAIVALGWILIDISDKIRK